jgi:hypothetical protein
MSQIVSEFVPARLSGDIAVLPGSREQSAEDEQNSSRVQSRGFVPLPSFVSAVDDVDADVGLFDDEGDAGDEEDEEDLEEEVMEPDKLCSGFCIRDADPVALRPLAHDHQPGRYQRIDRLLSSRPLSTVGGWQHAASTENT